MIIKITHVGSIFTSCMLGPLKVFLAFQWRFLLNKLCEVVSIFSSVSSVLLGLCFHLNQYLFSNTLEETQSKLAYFPLQSFASLLKSQTAKKTPTWWPLRPPAAWTSYLTFIVALKQSNSDRYTTSYLCLNQFSDFPPFFPSTCLPQWHLIVLNALGCVAAEQFSNPVFFVIGGYMDPMNCSDCFLSCSTILINMENIS